MVSFLTLVGCFGCAPDAGLPESPKLPESQPLVDTACDLDCDRINERWADAFAMCGVESSGPLTGCSSETAERRRCEIRCIEAAPCSLFTDLTGLQLGVNELTDYAKCVAVCPG